MQVWKATSTTYYLLSNISSQISSLITEKARANTRKYPPRNPVPQPLLEQEEIDPENITFKDHQVISFKSTSIPNFAKKLSEVIFTKEERRLGNFSGSKGRIILDQEKLGKIKTWVFDVHPMGACEMENTWRKCKNAINEAARRKDL